MSVDRVQADRIAHLARLRLEDAELGRITGELNRILEHVESLESITGEEGESAPQHLATGGAPTVADCAPTRGSEAEEADALHLGPADLAPDWRDGFFVVPPLPGVHDSEDA